MNWKIFSTVFVSSLLIAIPEKAVTCGPDEDPHDYFTSFFSRTVGVDKNLRPVYYTALLDFYDGWEDDSLVAEQDPVILEWTNYLKTKSQKDASYLIYSSKESDIKLLSDQILTNKPISGLYKSNEFAQALFNQKNKAAIDYLLFAKRAEPFSASPEWEEIKRDSLLINRFILQSTESFNKTNDPFLKTKYAFQRVKLAFYNHRYKDCIRWFDEYFNDGVKAAVLPLALAYKAGSLFRTGDQKQAAYLFSKAFITNPVKKKQNFLGFLNATEYCDPKLMDSYLTAAKNEKEKAVLTGMFALYGTSYKLENIKRTYELDPTSPLLSILAVREINKLEEQYFSPLLDSEKGGKGLYLNFPDEKTLSPDKSQLVKTIELFEKISTNNNPSIASVFGTAAAYLSFINKDYEKAKKLASAARNIKSDIRTAEQLQLIDLLILANESKQLTKEREAQILPATKWLTEKAKKDDEYEVFCRNFFSQVLAQKYEQQGDAYKAALAYGIADMSFTKPDRDPNYYYYNGFQFIQHDMATAELIRLYNLMDSKTNTVWDNFMISHSSFKKDDVIDVIGTSYLRDRDYSKSIEWLRKAGKLNPLIENSYNYDTDKETVINVDPFYDYLNDWQRFTKTVTKPFNKLTLSQKLLEIQRRSDTTKNTETKSKLYYEWASALYNMSYYGNSWSAVAYERSGSDWNHGNYKLAWQKEYYGVHKAKELYQKAYDATRMKEFKAACLFMVAKCEQRQVVMPDYNYENYDQYQVRLKLFETKFKNNVLFPRFVKEFKDTKFYQYTYSRCSYLRDFVTKR